MYFIAQVQVWKEWSARYGAHPSDYIAAINIALDAFMTYRLACADLRRQTLYDFELGLSLVVGGDQ